MLVLALVMACVAAGAYLLGPGGGGALGFFVGYIVLYRFEGDAYERGFRDGYDRGPSDHETDE